MLLEKTHHPGIDPPSVPQHTDVDRHFVLIDVALRITFLIVGPVPAMLLALHIGVAVELTTELIFWDSSYYQEHRWCPFVACILAGTACFAARRFRYFGSGVWIGPLLVAIGVSILVR